MADQLHGGCSTAGGFGQFGPALRMVQLQPKGIAPRSGVGRGQAVKPARTQRLQQHHYDPVPDADPLGLGDIMQQGRRQQLWRIFASRLQPVQHIQAVALILSRHVVEERCGRRWQDTGHQRSFFQAHPRRQRPSKLPYTVPDSRHVSRRSGYASTARYRRSTGTVSRQGESRPCQVRARNCQR